MVFIELLKKYENEVKETVDELFDNAYKNQKIDTELLLVIIHGFHDDKNPEFFKREKLSPYVFGPAHIGYSLDAFYEFFHFYRTTHKSKKAFTKLLQDSKQKETTEYHERLTLNLELLIESDWIASFCLAPATLKQIQAHCLRKLEIISLFATSY